MVATQALVGLIPMRETRQYFNDLAFKIAFRIVCRSLSAVITIHNKEYRPKQCGFCVANHTTPIDIAILSTDCSFSLVRDLKVFRLKMKKGNDNRMSSYDMCVCVCAVHYGDSQ